MELITKREVRKIILDKRDLIDFKVRKEWDKNIFHNLINNVLYKNAKVIFAFVSFKSEVDTLQIMDHSFKHNKVICVPKIKSKEKGISFYEISSLEDLQLGYYEILEPKSKCKEANVNDLELMLIPGVAFDRSGGRIGYGAGFYDKFLRNTGKNFNKIALSYHFQVIGNVPMDSHDVRIDGIITNQETIYITKSDIP
jgi:5-formyltetrahydrofolate cyclo-ligase